MKPYIRRKKVTDKPIGTPKKRSNKYPFIIEEKHKHHKKWSKLSRYATEKARDDAFEHFSHRNKSSRMLYYREMEIRKVNL